MQIQNTLKCKKWSWIKCWCSIFCFLECKVHIYFKLIVRYSNLAAQLVLVILSKVVIIFDQRLMNFVLLDYVIKYSLLNRQENYRLRRAHVKNAAFYCIFIPRNKLKHLQFYILYKHFLLHQQLTISLHICLDVAKQSLMRPMLRYHVLSIKLGVATSSITWYTVNFE